jgi:BirA family biotin operon repressor/biotin-[acetyl-CoA-carboxylase] ligase
VSEAPTRSEARRAVSYDGVEGESLRARLGVPRLELFAELSSTQDVAHALGAEGAAAGTIALADAQCAGRGRMGRSWHSAPGAGVWMTLLERPADPSALAVLSLRLGLHAAEALDRFATAPVRLKWPNDLYVGMGKLAGTLVEARWRDSRVDWVAIGFGLNVVAPLELPTAAGLRAGTRRVEVLEALVPALRRAASLRGELTSAELDQWRSRDLARGRRALAPVAGRITGITADGALALDAAGGAELVRAGSLVLEEE